MQYDDTQSIGRRYRRQDEIGTPFCVTIDFQSLEDKQVTVRERDSMTQIRIPIAELKGTLAAKLAGEALDRRRSRRAGLEEPDECIGTAENLKEISMKIIHFADLHLGVETYGHINPETGLSSRLEDYLKALDQVVDYAIENKIDLVLFCGDAYKSREPSQTQQREFAKRIKRLSEGGVPLFLLIGNHDLPNALGRATTIEIFDTLSVPNVYVANRPGIHRVQTNER